MSGNYYEGSSVFQSLSNLFPQNAVSQASQTQPASSAIMATIQSWLEKTIFGIPVWIIIVVAIVLGIALYMVM
jgi:uncharacterized membrane protein